MVEPIVVDDEVGDDKVVEDVEVVVTWLVVVEDDMEVVDEE